MAACYSVADDGWTEFYRDLLCLSQSTRNREFLTGSRVEIPRNEISMQKYDLDLRSTNDTDRMEYSIDRYAFALEKKVPEEFKGDVLRIIPSRHPGYVRLIRERNGESFQRITFLNEPYEEKKRNPAVEQKLILERIPDIGADIKSSLSNKTNLVTKVDRVAAVHCLYWPVEASEWITRKRCHACPSKSVIKQVVRYGCDFVGTAHKSNPDRDNSDEWRYSFSKAELIIIRNWTSLQRIAYRALRLIYKRMEKAVKETVLCSYYFKTLMLWACEERLPAFWTASSLMVSLRVLLKEMSDWLESRDCPNYFMPRNNIMDHLNKTDVSRDVLELRRRCNITKFLKVIELCKADEDLFAVTKYRMELPAFLRPSLRALIRVKNGFDDYRDLGSRTSADCSPHLKDALNKLLKDVYSGLLCHRASVTTTAAIDVNNSLKAASELLRATFDMKPSTECDRFDVDTVANDTLKAYFIRREKTGEPLLSEYEDISSNDTKLSWKPPSLATEVLGLAFQSKPVTNDPHGITDLITFNQITLIRFPGNVFPTVSTISWFVAKAYMANLQYTGYVDKSATVQTCNDIISAERENVGNLLLAHWILPVLVSTPLAAVFDKELQAMLGFYSLCTYVKTNTKRRSIHLGVCVSRFALYLKCRCALDTGTWQDIYSAIDAFNEHSTCRDRTVLSDKNETPENTPIAPISCRSEKEMRDNVGSYAITLVAHICTRAQREFAY